MRKERRMTGQTWALGAALLGVLLAASSVSAGEAKRCVVVWSEGTAPKNIYPKDINTAIAEGLQVSLPDWEVVVANLKDADQGLPDALLNRCDVLIWWGHQKHGDVKDELVKKVVKRVKEDGMGFISLHSSHFAKPNKALMGTACSWGGYLGDSKTCKVTVADAKHPIAEGIKEFVIPNSERYNDPYAMPKPDAVVFEGTFTLGNGQTSSSKQGFTFTVGKGKLFYFQPGHETNPIFKDENVKHIMANAVKWAAPAK
jgi:trehalose utilization protein